MVQLIGSNFNYFTSISGPMFIHDGLNGSTNGNLYLIQKLTP